MSGFVINPHVFTSDASPPVDLEVKSTSQGETTSGTSHNLDLPVGIVDGDLCLGFIAHPQLVTSAHGLPAGWSLLAGYSPSSAYRASVFYRVCDGSEGSSITITTSSSTTEGYIIRRIAGAAVNESPFLDIGFADGGFDPPNLNPTWDAGLETLWFALAHRRRADNSLTLPANYGDGVLQTVGSGGTATSSSRTLMGSRLLAADSENPGSFGFGSYQGGGASFALTIAVRPAV